MALWGSRPRIQPVPMPHSAALPFFLKKSGDAYTSTTITSTREVTHGLLRLDGDRLVIQWRVARKTEHIGLSMRTEEEVEPVREIVVPLASVADAAVRGGLWSWLRGGLRLVLTANDLLGFEGFAGAAGLKLDHPSRLVLRIRYSDRLAAEEFAAELALALAERSLRRGAEPGALAGRHAAPGGRLGGGAAEPPPDPRAPSEEGGR